MLQVQTQAGALTLCLSFVPSPGDLKPHHLLMAVDDSEEGMPGHEFQVPLSQSTLVPWGGLRGTRRSGPALLCFCNPNVVWPAAMGELFFLKVCLLYKHNRKMRAKCR